MAKPRAAADRAVPHTNASRKRERAPVRIPANPPTVQWDKIRF
jgi:hypothetical protein